jgi:diketogulonate reductase-like aldo/keto reductase
MIIVKANGASIPAIGLGTNTLTGLACVEAVRTALRLGYRHMDTAERYGNEAAVGEGLQEGLHATGLKREDVFVTTKVFPDRFAADEFQQSVHESLEKLKLSFVDLLLIHWPSPDIPLAEVLRLLCEARRDGTARHIGVANFTAALLDEAVRLASEPLVTNQIEAHPFLDHTKVLAACRKHGVSVTAYCPLARGRIVGHDVIERISKAHGKTASQIALRYLVQQDIVAIPRSTNPDHLAANLAVFDFTLTDSEMSEIGRLARPDGRLVKSRYAPSWDE